jgi:hypothetical protein
MQRSLMFAMVCTLSASAVALPVALRALRTDAERRAPESLDEAIEVADTLGLFYRYDGGGASCLLVSERGLPDPAIGPRMNNASHPFWIGTVAIYTGAQSMWQANYDPTCSLVWGNLFVYGDPDLIKTLTGRRP